MDKERNAKHSDKIKENKVNPQSKRRRGDFLFGKTRGVVRNVEANDHHGQDVEPKGRRMYKRSAK